MVSKLDIYIRAVTSFTYFHIIGNFKHIWNSIITWERNPINANNVVSHLDLQYLQVHRRNTRAEPNGLKDCGKSFCFHGSFKQHKRTHTVEKTHEYKKCSKILLQFWSLSYIYKRNHPGGKPCGGQWCDKAFGYYSCSTTFPKHENRKMLCV